jgi:hypothetical protein
LNSSSDRPLAVNVTGTPDLLDAAAAYSFRPHGNVKRSMTESQHCVNMLPG